jgi:hypothetical protein
MDAAGNWWTDTELNSYLDDWQDHVQDDLEFTMGTATASLGTGTSTITLTDVASDIMRPGIVTWESKELSPMTEQELDVYRRDWRLYADELPRAFYQNRMREIVLWPGVGTAGTLGMEYPLKMAFAADTSTSELPPWVRYSAKDYCGFRAYLRYGPNHSLNKAAVYKKRFNLDMKYFLEWKHQYLPERYGLLQPGTDYERKLVDPIEGGADVAVPTLTFTLSTDEVPSGTVNGSNDTFTLAQTPNPTLSLKLYVDGILMAVTTHYTLSGTTITFETAFIPISGQTLFASYKYKASN